uniref:Ribose-phosphate pyrophosphokinase N-terminal domain-containing protein n=1 Tax=Timema shepardi TaxID=629360 RepID=A0A7R9AR58_TIMSH|nr:unnamed protein product [Timema shepardi]
MMMDVPASSDVMIIGGNSHPELVNLIANRLGVKNGGCAVYHKTNRETMVEIGDSVRGKDIYIIQTGTKPHYSRCCGTQIQRLHYATNDEGLLSPTSARSRSESKQHDHGSYKNAAECSEQHLAKSRADVNNNIMELLIMAYACKTSSAKSIVGVIPYLPYSKQYGSDVVERLMIAGKMRKRGCIVSKLLAKMMCKSGLSSRHHHGSTPERNPGVLRLPGGQPASFSLPAAIHPGIPDYRNAVIVARNPGSAKKATSYAERLRLGIAVIHGEQKEAESDMVDGRYSPPTLPRSRTMDVGVGVPAHPAKEKPPINVVGDVGGRIAIMVDDMVDDVQSFVAAAEVLKERGAYKIYVLATHGLLSSDAPRLIIDSPIDEVRYGGLLDCLKPRLATFLGPLVQESGSKAQFTISTALVVVTNTIPHELQKMQCHKIKTVDISVLLSEAIRRIHNKESMSYLFKNVTLED